MPRSLEGFTAEELQAQLELLKRGGSELQRRLEGLEQYKGKCFRWLRGEKRRSRTGMGWIRFNSFYQNKHCTEHLYAKVDEVSVVCWDRAYPPMGITVHLNKEDMVHHGYIDTGRYQNECTSEEVDEVIGRGRQLTSMWCDNVLGGHFQWQEAEAKMPETAIFDFPHVVLTLDEQIFLSITPYLCGNRYLITEASVKHALALIDMHSKGKNKTTTALPGPDLATVLPTLRDKILNPHLAIAKEAPADGFARARSSL